MARNQCDGCARGLRRSDQLLHYDGDTPVIACTAYLYMPRPSRVELIRAMARAAAIEDGHDLMHRPDAYLSYIGEACAAYGALLQMLPEHTLPN